MNLVLNGVFVKGGGMAMPGGELVVGGNDQR